MTSHSNDSSFLQKVGGYTIIALLLGLGGGLAYQTFQMKFLKDNLSRNRELIKTELHSFRADLGRSQTNIVNTEKELRKLISDIPLDIKKDINRWGAEIVSAARFRFSSSVRNTGRVRPVKKKRSSENKTISLPVDLPKGNCNWDFSDWRLSGKFKGTCGAGSFTYDLKQTYEGILVEADSNGTSPSYIKIWEIGPDGKRLSKSLTLKDFTVTKRKLNLKKMHWLAPHLDVGISFQVPERDEPRFIPDVGISVSGYGVTSDDLDWRFFKSSIGPHEKGVSINLCPASYNLGKKLPLVSNIWVTPCYGYDSGHSLLLQLTGVL